MLKAIKRIIGILVLVIVLIAGSFAALVFFGKDTPLDSLRTDAINATLDATDAKEQLDKALRARAKQVAEEHGLPAFILESGVNMLDITNWKVTDLPDSATKAEEMTFDLNGTRLDITSYDDPGYLTAEVYGMEMTFAVPESAQNFVWVLPYLDIAEDAGLLPSDLTELGTA